MYQRVIDMGSYQIITTVGEINGDYKQYTKWADGTITKAVCMNIIDDMGWRSVEEFLRNRKGFKKVN